MKFEPVTLIIRGANVYNSYFKRFSVADVAIVGDRFLAIDKTGSLNGLSEIDATGKFLIPGLIDIHMHIESSMITPAAFAKRVSKCGVTTIVAEPHEMANVFGVKGVNDMISAAEGCPIDIFYGIPSSVPATSSHLEGTGGAINLDDMKTLLENPLVICVGEVMNFRQVIVENDLEITKFIEYLRKYNPQFPIEGHCPSLVGEELSRFLYLGINSDHTEHSLSEFAERFEMGMFVELQEKTISKEIIDYIISNNLFEHFCFVTDDVMADTLQSKGHLNAVILKAIELGMRAEDAIYNATYTPAMRMQLFDRGAVAPGKIADFVLLDDLNNFKVNSVYKNGKRIDDINTVLTRQFPDEYYTSVKLSALNEEDFKVFVGGEDRTVTVRVIKIQPNSTRTIEGQVEMGVVNGILQWEKSGVNLTAVFNRYGSGEVGFGFIDGVCHKSGAIASTYAHDCHNLVVSGRNIKDILIAANRVIEFQGGFVVANGGEVLAEIKLPVGGILSESSAEEVGSSLYRVRAAMEGIGYHHMNPFMSFGTLALGVSPSLKLTDKGLVDVLKAKIVPLIV